ERGTPVAKVWAGRFDWRAGHCATEKLERASTMRKLLVATVATLFAAALPKAAQAAPISGGFNFTLGSVEVSQGEIDWTPPSNPGNTGVNTYGSFEVQNDATRSGTFLGAEFDTLDEVELIQDMSENPA